MAKNKIISDRLNTFFTNNKMTVGESIPTNGTWSKGDIVISTIQANGECGWICVEAGTPGRWEIFGAGGGGSLIAINASEIVNNSVTEVSLSGLGVSVSPSDKLLVHYNSTHLFEGVDFEIVEEGTKIRKLGGGSWNESNEPNTLFAFELLKAVKSIDGDKISIDTKMVELKNNVNITSPVSEVTIGIDGFNKSSDVLTVYKNSTYMIEGIDYNIDETSKKIVSLKGNWNQSSESEYRFTFVVLKEVSDISPNATVNTNNLVNGSVTMEKLADDVRQAILDAGNMDLSNYATKAEVGNKNNLQTNNKNDLVAAINEVFQNANNGKTIIANAIGSPLVNSDTFSVMGTKIDSLTLTFQKVLTEKGIEVLQTDKISGLIDKTRKINMGKKFATGKCTAGELIMEQDGVSFYWYIEEKSLDFLPNTIIIIPNKVDRISSIVIYTDPVSIFCSNGQGQWFVAIVNKNYNGTLYYKNGFKACVYKAGSVTTGTFPDYTWYAFE